VYLVPKWLGNTTRVPKLKASRFAVS